MIESGTYSPYRFLGLCNHVDSMSLQFATHKDSLDMDCTRKAYKIFARTDGKRYLTMDTMLPV